MRVPWEWLKAFVTVRRSPASLAERLTMAGLEVVAIPEVDGEPVLDLEVTPNRADCLSILGIAREVAAITGQHLKRPIAQGSGLKAQGKTRKPRTPSPEPRAPLVIRIEDRQGCPRYLGRLIRGVQVAPSPAWMQRRLIACGARPINNLVDITNYVLLEYGQPLHAFDVDRLAGRRVVVRRARAGESLTTLDGERRALSPETLVVADGQGPVAVAGVMGGVGSEVVPGTTQVLLESAVFDPITVRRAARRLGVASESSYRFERGVDPIGVDTASARAAALICELAGGTEAAVYDVGAKPSARPAIVLEVEQVRRWLGMSWEPSAVRTTLARLSCRVASTGSPGTLHVTPPSFRRDLTQPVDLCEELARVAGYDRLPSTIPSRPMAYEPTEASRGYQRLQALRGLCASAGLTEAINWSLISEESLARCGMEAEGAVKLANPLSQEHAYVRPALLPGLLRSVQRNVTRGVTALHLFELGRVVRAGCEEPRLGIVLSGLWSRDWQGKRAADFFCLKGILQALLRRLCDGELSLQPAAHPWTEPGQGTALALEGCPIGWAGEVAHAMLAGFDIEQPVWAAELSVQELLGAPRTTQASAPPPTVPPVKRDLSILVRQETPFASIHQAIREAGAPLAARVELIDRYTGSPVPQAMASLTFSIEYRDPSRTLTSAAVEALHQRIGHTLASRFGATLR